MSVVNNGDRVYDYITGERVVPSLMVFANAERRIKEKEAAIEDLENELNLLKEQGLRTYRAEVRYLIIGQENMWNKAQKWISMLKTGTDDDGNKLDKRKKYSEKSIFEYLQSAVGKILEIENFKIDNIINYNFTEGFNIEFSYLDHKWELCIPIVNNIKMRSYETYGGNCFQLRLLFYTSPSCATTIGCTFEEDNLKNIMQQGIEKYCNKENENEQKTG